jgi:enediyne biosynthesis protein E4
LPSSNRKVVSTTQFSVRTAAVVLLLAHLGSAGRASEWIKGTGCRWTRLDVATTGRVGFTRLNPAELGIDFTNALSDDRVVQFQNLMNGAGLAALDYDGDGRPDLYFIHKQSANQLYRNLGGWRFTNVTAVTGVACTNQSSVGALAGDVNGDGAPDLVVSSFGGPHALLLNDGKGRFTDVTVAAGVIGSSGGTSMAFADVDGDGALDLYFCNFAVQALLRDGATVSTRVINGKPTVTGRYARRMEVVDGVLRELGDPDVLFLNDGKGRFTPVEWEKHFTDAAGHPSPPPPDLGLAVQIRDVNGDGFPDIYVCNDFQTPDHLWFGDGRGHFKEVPNWALRNMSFASMGVDFADLDRDGRMDFITVEMAEPDLGAHFRSVSAQMRVNRTPGQFADREEFPRNCLYRQRDNGSFAEIAAFAGVAATSWSWTPLFLDVDLDGWEDLLVSNGHMHDVNNRDVATMTHSKSDRMLQATKDMLPKYPPLDPPKCAFRNRRDLTFEDAGEAWGFNAREIAHGMITADLDGDGDLDVILNCLTGPPIIYRNDCDKPRVAVRLKGRKPNTAGIGGKITLKGGPVEQTQEVVAGGQYLSCSDPMRVFAAGPGAMTIEVRWRSGLKSVITGVEANTLYEIDETEATPPPSQSPAQEAPIFQDATARLAHRHYEEPFPDFAHQPLLPKALSQLGPAVEIADLNGDGSPDIVVGAGRGGHVTIFLGDGRGGFKTAELPGPPLPDDVLGLVILRRNDGASIIAALANYESGDSGQPAVLRWDFANGKFQAGDSLPAIGASPAALALGDIDGDGAPELFVGGRVLPRHWPRPTDSKLFRNDNGHFVPDVANCRVLEKLGMVTAAKFIQLTADSAPTLVVATEFGPVRLLRPDQGRLKQWDPPVIWEGRSVPLSMLTGLWSALAAADVDGDGRTDILVGNWGLNSSWQIWGDGKPRVAFADFTGEGFDSVMEAVAVHGVVRPWRDRDYLSKGLVDLPARFPTHALFSEASLDAVLGPVRNKAEFLAVETLASLTLLNRGDHFEARALPAEAQWSCINAMAVADVDGDGRPDVYLAQNCFSVRPEDARLDAGEGLLLHNEGGGRFTVTPPTKSGVAVFGDQRGAAAGDLDGDGRPDLVVTQNGAETRLFLSAHRPQGK